MKIEFQNRNIGTSISIDDDQILEDGQINIMVKEGDQDLIHSFSSLREYKDFCDAVDEFKTRLKKYLDQ